MSRHAKTERVINAAFRVLQDHRPMTVRQLFYALVSSQVSENTIGSYKSVCRALVAARKDGTIPWAWIEDRLRRPRHVSMWADLPDFVEIALRTYRRDLWDTQPIYVEAWLEKDALSGIFEDVLEPYGVTLNVGRGYDGWTSIKDAAERYRDRQEVVVVYYGDFDPSGEDMVRSLRQRLSWFGSDPRIIKGALNREDIARYDLPPNFTKTTDTRRAAFVAQHGDIAVELDALPVDVLRRRIIADVEAHLDLVSLAQVRSIEAAEIERLRQALSELRAGDATV